MNTNRTDFIDRSKEAITGIFDELQGKPDLKLTELESSRTALFIIDMVNGFAREGMLQSPRVEGIIPEICRLSQACGERNIKKIAFTDSHTGKSPEFQAYPVHCTEGSHESEVVDEIKEIGEYTLIPKNSTNGFHEEPFIKWLNNNQSIENFIITGDCTDICILQFATTLKTWFNKQNRDVRVIVPMNAVETYDLGLHSGDLVHVMALYNMMINGIEIVKRIKI